MATFTPEGYSDELKKRLTELNKGSGVELAARTSMALMSRRIFSDGLKANGSAIGSYDTKNELYISDENLPRRGTHTGKTGKRTKTSYYKNYKAARDQQGRESSGVNLRWTNVFQSDFNNARVARGADVVGQSKPIKVNNLEFVIALKASENVKKRKGIEDKYGNIFTLSQKEEKAFTDQLILDINKIND